MNFWQTGALGINTFIYKNKNMKHSTTYEITAEDVGRLGRRPLVTIPACRCCGRGPDTITVDFSPLGRVMKCDIGKRMYYFRETRTWHVENQQQFEKRTKK